MPPLSRRRRAIKLIARTTTSRFRSKTVEIIELCDDGFFDIDDDWISNFRDIGEDAEIDTIEDETREALPVLSVDFVSKCKLWREVGFNTGVRGAGSSKSTFKRLKRKNRDNARAAFSSKKITGFLRSENINSNAESGTEIVSEIPTAAPIPAAVIALAEALIADESHESNGEEDYFRMLDPYDIFSDDKIEEAIVVPPIYTMPLAISNLLSVEAKITRNQRVEKKSFLMKYQSVQGLALVRYFQLILEGVDKMKASSDVAQVLYQKSGIWSYKARSIRGWGSHYLKTGELKMFRQGMHVKTSSIITDEHVQALLLVHLNEMRDEMRTPENFMKDCNQNLFKQIPNAPNSISLSTSTRWMKFLGFHPKLQMKDYYTDGHNRSDVVEYRDAVFLPTMLDYERRMQEYSGDKMETIFPPELSEGEKRVVLITHDESTFYCCEGKPMMWMENGKNKLLPKTKGTSLMISGFCCDCHAFFSNGTLKSYSTFEAGKNREGWFTNNDLVNQFNALVPLIKDLHENCDIVIAFDNSMTHHAQVPEGLDVANLKMSDGKPSHVTVDMRSGRYVDLNGVEQIQPMQYPRGKQKGVKQILLERGNKHKNDQGHVLFLQCNVCKLKTTAEERRIGIEEGHINVKCCASYVLSNEPDFLAQEEWLTQVVHDAGFEIIFYPKYHCELNYIEMIWGWVKSYHRRTCTYNYKDLKDRLPKTFDDLLPLSFVRKVFQHCLRFMSGYRQGLEGPLLDYAMTKYTSHGTVPVGVATELAKEYDKYLKIKIEKNKT